MSGGLLRPVYYGKKIEPAEKPPGAPPKAGKKGLLPMFADLRWLKWATRAHVDENEYFYAVDLKMDFGLDPDPNRVAPTRTFKGYGVRYEMSDADFDKINHIKDILRRRLSPILENHGAEFSYETGGPPGETPKRFRGAIRWYVRQKNRAATKRMSYFRVEGGAGKIIITDSGKAYNRSPYAAFIAQLRPPSSHSDHHNIPPRGIGSDCFLEDIFAVLEGNDFKDLPLQDWNERLDWFCGMIEKHQEVVFKPLRRALLKAVFNSIRARAIKVEN